MKKVLSFILALTLVLSLMVPAFAGEGNEEAGGAGPITTEAGLATGAETTIKGEVAQAMIKVTVPATANLILNPYKLKYKTKDAVEAEEEGGEGTPAEYSTDEIIFDTQRIISESNVDLRVTATVTGTATEGVTMTYETTHGATPPTTKQVNLAFDIVAQDPQAIPEGEGKSVDDITWPEVTWNLKRNVDAQTGVYSYTGYDPKKCILVLAEPGKVENICTIKKCDDDKASAAAFHIIGDATAAPATPWSSSDKVTVKIAFTFQIAG